MRIKSDGYYIEVKNKEGYPSEYIGLRITNEDNSRYWFGGGYRTRLAVFQTYGEARKVANRQIRIFQKRHGGKFIFSLKGIKFSSDKVQE